MKGVNDLDKIVALTLCSAYVEGDKPLSLLIISDRPESGKTEMVKQFSKTPYVEFASDVSGYGIMRDFAVKILRGEIRHIVIPELLRPLMKGHTAANNFTATLGTVMEDGIMGQHTGFLTGRMLDKEKEIKAVGIIGCMPRMSFSREMRRQWVMTGFLSRWLIVTYKYNSEAVDLILGSIRTSDYLKRDEQILQFDGINTHITLPEDVSIGCEKLGLEITAEARKAGSAYGFREIKHIRSLVAACVIYDRIVNKSDRDTATMADFDEVQRLGYLFNEQYNEVIQ